MQHRSAFRKHTAFGFLVIWLTSTFLAGCQTLKAPVVNNPHAAKNAVHFRIAGKIGVRYFDQYDEKKYASAFYAWGQQGTHFAIDLTGVLGMGKTHIAGTQAQAKLTNQKTGTLTGSPEALLLQTTGWHAPISQLPYWILGKPTPLAMHNQFDVQNRLIKSVASTENAHWLVEISYKNTSEKPHKLNMFRLATAASKLTAESKKTANKVTLTITHQ